MALCQDNAKGNPIGKGWHRGLSPPGRDETLEKGIIRLGNPELLGFLQAPLTSGEEREGLQPRFEGKL